jgi:hypothetical protein
MKNFCYVLIKDKAPCRQSFEEYEDAVQAFNDNKKENPSLFREYYEGGSIQIM